MLTKEEALKQKIENTIQKLVGKGDPTMKAQGRSVKYFGNVEVLDIKVID